MLMTSSQRPNTYWHACTLTSASAETKSVSSLRERSSPSRRKSPSSGKICHFADVGPTTRLPSSETAKIESRTRKETSVAKLGSCRTCKAQVSSEARSCPRCGQPFPFLDGLEQAQGLLL